MTDPNASPLNPLPPAVWVLALTIGGIELLFALGALGWVGGPGAVGWRIEAIQSHAFSAQILDWMISNRYFPLEHMARFVTYPFVHVSFTHTLFVVVFVLALGKMVGEIFSTWALFAVFFGAAIVGALAYGLVVSDATWLVGGYPAVYGLIGAFTFLLWVNLAAVGANKYRAFTLIAVLLSIQLLFGLLFGGTREWVADLAGFATGFFLSFVVSPGGWQHALDQLRQR